MITEFELGGIAVEVVQKDIKNVHLSVNPPHGKVRISAPLRMDLNTIRAFALSKLSWIKSEQQKFQLQEREIPREFLDRESHYVWGKRYLLTIVETDVSPNVSLTHDKMVLKVRPGTSKDKMKELVDEWYRGLLREAAPPVIDKWAPILGVSVEKLFVQQMKTKWGGANPAKGAIRLNTELAKKPPEFLEYVILHEMLHLKVPNHNQQFFSLMDLYMPNWKHLRSELNRLAVPYGEWN